MNKITVGDLRKSIANLPDDAEIVPEWEPGFNAGDDEPSVSLQGFIAAEDKLVVLVELVYGDEYDDADLEWHECDNCLEEWTTDDLLPVKDLAQRVDPGGRMPAGECPDCGCLCYPLEDD